MESEAKPKPQLVTELDGRKVTLEMTFRDHYEAMQFYDELVTSSCRDGNFTLSMEVNPRG